MTQAFATYFEQSQYCHEVPSASVTIINCSPTIIVPSFYGMNVLHLPLSDRPLAFETIFGFSVIMSVAMGLLMWKKNILKFLTFLGLTNSYH